MRMARLPMQSWSGIKVSIFGRKTKLNNAAAGTLPPVRPIIQPGPTTIHNHSTGWAGIIAVGFSCLLVLLPVGWFVLVFLFEKMGGSEKEAALLVVSIPVAFAVGWLISWLAPLLINAWRSWDLEIAKEVTRREELKLLATQTTIEPGRMQEADYEFARVVLAVMMRAYSWLEKEQSTRFPARWRPWSLSSSRETAEQIGVKLTQTQANRVSVWLHEHGVITSPDGGQITDQFPNLSSVRAMLDNEFGKPIQVVSPALRDNLGYKHIG